MSVAYPSGYEGLIYSGRVTAIGADQFTIPTLAGLGAGKFADATAPYRAFVLRDAGGASLAPQGEMQTITAYVSATGTFTAPGFGGGGIAIDDEVMIIPARLAEIAAVKAQTDKIAGKMLFSMDFWSTPQEEVQLTNVAGDKSLPSVVIADLPATATIVRAIAMFKFRMIENTGAANKLAGAQEIQVNDSAATGWVDAINFVDDQFGIAATTREGGDVCIGAIDIANRVNGNDTYSFQWDEAVADLANLQFNDCACGLRIWYSV